MKRVRLFASGCFWMITVALFGQDPQVLLETNVDSLILLSAQWKQESAAARQGAEQQALQMGIPLRTLHSDGKLTQFLGLNNGMPAYLTTENLVAARTTATDKILKGGANKYQLSGAGKIVGEWDGSATRLTHREFVGRVIQRDNSMLTTYMNHATHVAGTLVGSGVRPEARGMAPEATLWTHDWDDDQAEMADAASKGLLISNHSYGKLAGWQWGDWANPGTSEWHWFGDVNISQTIDYQFGFYDGVARSWDQIAHLAPYYLIVKSSGNNRGTEVTGTHKAWINGAWRDSSTPREKDGGAGGYDCIPFYATAKNILTVGNVYDLPNGYAGSSNLFLFGSSSTGPTDDGRIKPDIVGNGTHVLSSTAASDESYDLYTGTSMSSPNVAGSLLLLQELYQQMNKRYMRAATLRGLIIHTADEAGIYPGPDYTFGWGLLNAGRAAQYIEQDGLDRFITEAILTSGQTHQVSVYSNGVDPARVTICWTDPAALATPPGLNDRRLKLVNDLDVRLVSADNPGMVYMPYQLDPLNPAAQAVKQDNIRDNVEQVYAGVLPEGEYYIRVTHKNALQGGQQSFSIISSLPKNACLLGKAPDRTVYLSCGENRLNTLKVSPFNGMEDLEYSLDGKTYQSSNEFANLPLGNYRIWMRDDLGCLAQQYIRIMRGDSLELAWQDSVVFMVQDDEDTYSFEHAYAFSQGWGSNPEEIFVHGQAIFARDDSANPTRGCGDLVNKQDLRGKIVFFDRGGCEYSAKALKAQQAGALAVGIINISAGLSPLTPGALGSEVHIPVFMIGLNDGNAIREQIESGELTMRLGLQKAIREAGCMEASDGEIRPYIRKGFGPYTYQWDNGVTTLTNTVAMPGMHSLTVRDENGCERIYEFEVPAAEPPILLSETVSETCLGEGDGQIVLLNAAVLGSWTLSLDGLPITSDTLRHVPAGAHSITLWNPQNQCTFSFDVEVTGGVDLEPGELSGPPSAVVGVPYTYSVQEVEGAEYVWQVSGGTILEGQGTHEVLVEFDAEEYAVLKVTVTLETCIREDSVQVIIESSRIHSADLSRGIQVYPNPVGSELHVDVGQGLEIEALYLQPLTGNRKLPVTWTDGQIGYINTAGLAPGIYLLRGTSSRGPVFIRIIRQ
jgi:hypothetical protein